METPRVVLTWPEKEIKVPKTPKKKKKASKKDPPDEVCTVEVFSARNLCHNRTFGFVVICT